MKTTYKYDQADRLTGFTNQNGSSSYIYNGDGLRMSKTVGGTKRAFVWDLADGLPLTMQDGAAKFVTGPTGLPLEQYNSGILVYFYQDQLGSTRELLDTSGKTQASYTYDAYGNVVASTTSSGNTTSFQYAGQYTDGESGLQYLRARYYDPNTQQFLTVDPIVDQTGQPYGYARDDPVNLADLGGFCPSRREATFWGPVHVGTCTAEITGPGKDSRGTHYNLRIFDARGHDIRNYHIYYKGLDKQGRMSWNVILNRRGHYLRTETYAGARPGDSTEQQVAVASGEMAKEVERSITTPCGENNIGKLLTEATETHPDGALQSTFFDLYSRKTGNDAVEPGWCPLPKPFSCQ
jgi:RHS repeat-associated protein